MPCRSRANYSGESAPPRSAKYIGCAGIDRGEGSSLITTDTGGTAVLTDRADDQCVAADRHAGAKRI